MAGLAGLLSTPTTRPGPMYNRPSAYGLLATMHVAVCMSLRCLCRCIPCMCTVYACAVLSCAVLCVCVLSWRRLGLCLHPQPWRLCVCSCVCPVTPLLHHAVVAVGISNCEERVRSLQARRLLFHPLLSNAFVRALYCTRSSTLLVLHHRPVVVVVVCCCPCIPMNCCICAVGCRSLLLSLAASCLALCTAAYPSQSQGPCACKSSILARHTKSQPLSIAASIAFPEHVCGGRLLLATCGGMF